MTVAARARQRFGSRPQVPAALWVPAAIAALVALAPLWYLISQASSRGASVVADEIFQRSTVELIRRSLTLTIAVTAACAAIGTFAAWVVSLAGVRARSLVTIAFTLPLAIPSYLSAFAWISRWPSLNGFWGAFIVLTFASFPYVMLPVAASMSRLDPVHEDVARSLGRSPLAIVLSVILPQVRRAILAGSLLVALYVLSDFGAVATMRYEVFTWVIYGSYRTGFNPARAAILALLLVVLALILTGAESKARGRAVSSRTDAGIGRQRERGRIALRLMALIGAASIVVPSVGVPVAGVIDWMGRSTSRGTSWSSVRDATVASFTVGIVVALVALAAALPVALLSVRHPGRLSRLIESSTYITHALPGIVVAISVVYLGIRAVRPLYQQWPMVVFAHVILFLPVMVASISAALEKSSPTIEDVARSLGTGPVTTFFRVTLPVAAPGILAGTALTMLAAVKELPATLLLRPTGFDTLSTEIWRYSSVSDYAALGPYALAILLVAAVPTALLGTLSTVKEDAR